MGQDTLQLVASVTPLLNAVVHPDAVVTIVFKQHIEQDSISADTVQLKLDNDTLVEATYKYTGMTMTLEIKPTSPLSPGMYTLYIPEGEDSLRSVTGVYAREYTHTFSVEEAAVETFSEPEGDLDFEPEEEDTPLAPDGLFLMDSYPSEQNIRTAGEPIVLVFSRAVNSEDLIGEVVIRPKAIHPLLANIGSTTGEIALTPTEPKTDTTHVLTPAVELAEGMEAVLTLSPTLMEGETINILFQQNWDRMYTSVGEVRLVLGMFAQAFTDMELSRMIYRESKNTYQLMLTRPIFVEAEWAGNLAPYAAGQYVLYSTAYKAILGQALESGSGMRQGFVLGDFSVTQSESTSREIKDLLGLLKEEVDRWWKFLNGFDDFDEMDVFIRRGGSATRGGEFSSYPDFMTRVPFADLGG